MEYSLRVIEEKIKTAILDRNQTKAKVILVNCHPSFWGRSRDVVNPAQTLRN